MFKPCYSYTRLLLRHPNKCSSPQLHARSASVPKIRGISCAFLIVHFPLKEWNTWKAHHAGSEHTDPRCYLAAEQLHCPETTSVQSSAQAHVLFPFHAYTNVPISYLYAKDFNNNTFLLFPAHSSQPQHTPWTSDPARRNSPGENQN